jgi:hypothetical protein
LSNAEVEAMVSNAAVAAAEAVMATAAVAAVVETAVEAATTGPVLDKIVAAVDAATVDVDPFVETVVRAARDAAAATAAPPALTPEEEFHKAFKHLTDAELAAFFGMPAGPGSRGQGLSTGSSGGFGGPTSRGGGTVGTIIINAPLVTGDQVIGALHDAVENEGLTLPPRWSGSLGR